MAVVPPAARTVPAGSVARAGSRWPPWPVPRPDQDGSSWVTRFLPSSERRQGGHPFAVIDTIG